jgi:hypothetical protein
MLDWIKVILSHGLTLKSRKKTIIVSKFLHQLHAIFYGLLTTRLILRIFPLIDALHLSRKIIKVSLEHMVAWKNISNPIEEQWITPLTQWFKINFNTAIRDIYFFGTSCNLSKSSTTHHQNKHPD